MKWKIGFHHAILGVCWVPAAGALLVLCELLPGDRHILGTLFIAFGIISVLLTFALLIMGIHYQEKRKSLLVGAAIASVPACLWIYLIGYIAIFGLGH